MRGIQLTTDWTVIRIYPAGVDIAKKQHEIRAIDDQATIVLARPVPNTHPGAARFLAAVRKRVGDHDLK